jgi:hypothetical protein
MCLRRQILLDYTSYAVTASSWYLPALGPEGTPAQDVRQHGTSPFSVVPFRARSAKTNNDRKKSTAVPEFIEGLPKAMIANEHSD